ncbi:DUF354 domain-containing protein [Flavobacteriaceae bacterium F08102]|nr:DUF354 domain-containing protein [Flavobacteriaceae bacterium F08102]
MKILIDIGHPAHVHIFKHFTREMQKNNHEVLFTCREKEFEIDLLRAEGFRFISFGKKYKSLFGKILGLLVFNLKMLKAALKFKPDVFLSAGSMYAAQVAWLLRKPHISMEDTGNMEQIKLYLPFSKVVFTPYEIPEQLGKKQFRYHSYHELCYLSPPYFTPNEDIYSFLEIPRDQKFAILRFVSWDATHDVGQGGFTAEHKDQIVEYLSKNYALFISSEGDVPDRYKKYLFKIPPDKMHDAMAFASLVVSEGATMASEAGVLGTPSIYVNSLVRCYNEDQEKYGLVFNFQSSEGVLAKIKAIQEIEDVEEVFEKRRQNMLADKIDFTSFLLWFVQEYPASQKIIFDDPAYQERFKF